MCSHGLTDAPGLIDAVADALAGKGIATEAGPSDASDSDLRDALQLTGRVSKLHSETIATTTDMIDALTRP